MKPQFMVLLVEEGGTARGEIKFLDGPDEVTRYVEVLLEGGFARESIRVFHGDEIDLEISYRPVVALSVAGEAQSDADGEAPPGDGEWRGGDLPAGEAPEVDEEQGVLNGVRFSEQFRPS